MTAVAFAGILADVDQVEPRGSRDAAHGLDDGDYRIGLDTGGNGGIERQLVDVFAGVGIDVAQVETIEHQIGILDAEIGFFPLGEAERVESEHKVGEHAEFATQ